VADHFIGIDIGGTKTLAVVHTDDGTILERHEVARPTSPEQAVSQLVDIIEQLRATSAGANVAAVGIGIAGAISLAGSVQFSPNIPEIVDFPLKDRLTGQLDLPIVVENDATAATWAEHQIGAGQGVANMLYVALGTGIGTGFVLDGSVYRGAHGFAGESGHMVVDRHGDTHISGVRGPWEMRASGNGLGALAREWAQAGRLDSLLSADLGAPDLRGEHVSAAVAAGNEEALAVLDEFANDVALGMTNLIYILDPERIVLGGGLVAIGEPLRSRVQDAVDRTTLGGAFRPTVPVVLAALGSSSGAVGAGLLAAHSLA